MPFYRYECDECGEVFRVLHRNGSNDGAETKCPKCGSTRAKRLLPRIGVIYKGSGYYSTDYRSKKAKVAKSAKGDGEKLSKDAGEAASAGTTTKAEQSES